MGSSVNPVVVLGMIVLMSQAVMSVTVMKTQACQCPPDPLTAQLKLRVDQLESKFHQEIGSYAVDFSATNSIKVPIQFQRPFPSPPQVLFAMNGIIANAHSHVYQWWGASPTEITTTGFNLNAGYVVTEDATPLRHLYLTWHAFL